MKAEIGSQIWYWQGKVASAKRGVRNLENSIAEKSRKRWWKKPNIGEIGWLREKLGKAEDKLNGLTEKVKALADSPDNYKGLTSVGDTELGSKLHIHLDSARFSEKDIKGLEEIVAEKRWKKPNSKGLIFYEKELEKANDKLYKIMEKVRKLSGDPANFKGLASAGKDLAAAMDEGLSKLASNISDAVSTGKMKDVLLQNPNVAESYKKSWEAKKRVAEIKSEMKRIEGDGSEPSGQAIKSKEELHKERLLLLDLYKEFKEKVRAEFADDPDLADDLIEQYRSELFDDNEEV